MPLNIFSDWPPLYDLFDKAEFRALHAPCNINSCNGHTRFFAISIKIKKIAEKIEEINRPFL